MQENVEVGHVGKSKKLEQPKIKPIGGCNLSHWGVKQIGQHY
jgi:hypothetical protein